MGEKIKDTLGLDYTLTPGDIGEFSIYFNGVLAAKKSAGTFPSMKSVIETVEKMRRIQE